MKVLFLYREVIITSQEFLSLTKKILVDISEELFDFVKELIYTREKNRRKVSENFKSVQNLDTSGMIFIYFDKYIFHNRMGLQNAQLLKDAIKIHEILPP